MATKKKVKSPTRRLYEHVHELIVGSMDSNCFMQVLGEFAWGHEGKKAFKGKRLTTKEWLAVLKYSGVTHGLVFFGGVRSQVEEDSPFGQEAFVRFLKRNGCSVEKIQNDIHVSYIAHLPKSLIDAANKMSLASYYRDDPTREEWNDF